MQLYENDDNLVQATSAIHSAGISTLQLRFYNPFRSAYLPWKWLRISAGACQVYILQKKHPLSV